MKRLMASGVVALALVGLAVPATAASPDSVLLGEFAWSSFAGIDHSGSLAWAGEDETYFEAVIDGACGSLLAGDANHVDRLLLTGMPAPEPPALVLAGLAFAGVLCGRSLLRRRLPEGSDVTA